MKFKLSDFGIEACNVYFTGICNLNCVYCFQPKLSSHMSEENNKIKEWLSSGKFIEDIKNIYGDNIKDLSLWGGEPTLNLPQLQERLEDIFKEFQKVISIDMSSNFSTSQIVSYVENFLLELERCNKLFDRKVIFNFQISIDGVSELNDKTRIGSSSDTIMSNVTEFLQFVTDNNIKSVKISFKGTHGADGIKWLSEGDNLEKHYHYFDDYRALWEERKFSIIPKCAEYLTFVTPGHYTQEDGFNLAKITEKLVSKEFQEGPWKSSIKPTFDTQLSSKFKETFDHLLRYKVRDFEGELACNTTCGATRGIVGLSYDGRLHWCHSTYFFNQDSMNQIVENNLVHDFEKHYGFDFKNYENFVEGRSIVNTNNDIAVLRTINLGRGLNRYLSLRVQLFDMLVRELCISGQISSCFEDSHMRNLAVGYLLYSGLECISNNNWEYGTPWIRGTDQFKLLLNGTFELYLDNYLKG